MFLLAITLLATSCGNVNTKEGTKEVEIAKLSIDKKYQQNDLKKYLATDKSNNKIITKNKNNI